MTTITLTEPVTPADVRAVVPAARAMDDAAITLMLRIEERALRVTVGVYDTEAETDAALHDALLIGFAAFRQAMMNTRNESIGSGFASATVATGDAIIDWPPAVYVIMGAEPPPSTTELVR